jgi:hypothetical protein
MGRKDEIRHFASRHPSMHVVAVDLELGPMLCFFEKKNSAKKLVFLTQNKAKLFKILIITLVFEKNANFFAKNEQKMQKLVIITSTPGVR